MMLRARLYIEAGVFPESQLKGFAKQLSAILTHYVSWRRLEHLRKTNIPVLVCSGELDNLIAPRNSKMLARSLLAKHLHFDDAGHCCNEQYPAEVNAAIREIMDRGDKNETPTVGPASPSWHPGLPLSAILPLLACIGYGFVQGHAISTSYWLALGTSGIIWHQLL